MGQVLPEVVDDALKTADLVIRRRGRETTSLERVKIKVKNSQGRDSPSRASVVMRTYQNEVVTVEVDDECAVSISLRVGGRSIRVLTSTLTNGVSWRDEVSEALAELRRVVVLDLLAEAAQ